MKVVHESEIAKEKMDVPGAENVTIQWLVGEEDDPPNFYMRLFEVEKGGCSPRHSHDYEHEVFVLDGRGTVYGAGGEKNLRSGSAVLMPAGEEHQFKNVGDGPLRFLCMVPKTAK